MKKTFQYIALALLVTGCSSDADMASHNLSKASEQFEVIRKVTLYNVIQDVGMISVEGRCSVEFFSAHSEVTCKTDNGTFVKHMMEKSHNTSMLVEQMEAEAVSTYQYRVLVKPSVLIPDFDIVTPKTEGNS